MSDVAETKVCPKCAEEVKARALVCRYCSYSFEADKSPEKPVGGATRSEPTHVHPLAVVVVLAGAIVLVIALFLPYASSPSGYGLVFIERNTVLKQGGWPFLVAALLAVLALYWVWRTAAARGSLVVVGAAVAIWSVHLLADKSERMLGRIDPRYGPQIDLFSSKAPTYGGAGAGLYLGMLGSLLLVVGGLLVAFPSLTSRRT